MNTLENQCSDCHFTVPRIFIEILYQFPVQPFFIISKTFCKTFSVFHHDYRIMEFTFFNLDDEILIYFGVFYLKTAENIFDYGTHRSEFDCQP